MNRALSKKISCLRARWPTIIVRLVLGAVFLWAGAEKISHPTAFLSSLLDYDVPLPETFFRIVAISLPWFEVCCAFTLLFNVWTETVGPLVAALCLVFVLMLGQALIRRIDISNCGCFGRVANGWIDRPAIAFLRAVVLFSGSLYLCAASSSSSGEAVRRSVVDPLRHDA
jgi:uncharacterized membrane protein YphA (DoxX/SURF4 family)